MSCPRGGQHPLMLSLLISEVVEKNLMMDDWLEDLDEYEDMV